MGSTVWKSQSLESLPISVDDVRRRVNSLNDDYRVQKGAIYAGVAVCAGLFVLTFMPLPGYELEVVTKALRLALVIVCIGGIYLHRQVLRRASEIANSGRAVADDGLRAYRSELLRRRDYYLDAWRWSLWPAIAALVVLFGLGAMYDPAPNKILRYGLAAIAPVVGIVMGVWYQLRKGNEYQRELDELQADRYGAK